SISCRMANFSDALYCLLGMKKTPFTAAGFIISPVYLKGSISNEPAFFVLYCIANHEEVRSILDFFEPVVYESFISLVSLQF
ncbi:hypothetical protein, partial [Paenibacillus thermoaerophilus]|uniref:hypothetical protein n=1 Tax=Paenibacillus thermoaerophilus TaxID=1215385 RepID=UPI001B8864B5